jgi:hypothetical protein
LKGALFFFFFLEKCPSVYPEHTSLQPDPHPSSRWTLAEIELNTIYYEVAWGFPLSQTAKQQLSPAGYKIKKISSFSE